jgi:hypothetical protein
MLNSRLFLIDRIFERIKKERTGNTIKMFEV